MKIITQITLISLAVTLSLHVLAYDDLDPEEETITLAYDYEPSNPNKGAVYPTKDRLKAHPGNFYHLKLGGGNFAAGNSSNMIPYMTFGRRFEMGDSAVDVSVGGGQHKSDSGLKSSYITLPKLTYIHFDQAYALDSLFYGGGLSWSSVKNDGFQFRGIYMEGTIGYEFKRNTNLRPMVQLDISQPLLAEKKIGSHPRSSLMLGLSMGF